MAEVAGDGAAGGVSPAAIMQQATAYWSSMALLTAVRLDIFAQLAAGNRTIPKLAGACGGDARALTMLVNTLVAHGFVERQNGEYQNGASAAAFLVPGKPGYLGDALKYAADQYPVWGELESAVRSGRPPGDATTAILGGDPDKTRNFVLAMHNRALGVARAMASSLDLTGRRQLLDVGGGPGTYSILLTERTPGLVATVLDLPPVLEISREIIASMGAADRVHTRGGNYRDDPFPTGNDVVLMWGMFHRETESTCRELIAKAAAALAPGGLLIIADVFFDDAAKTAPLFATLFALNMMLTADDGGAHAKSEVATWMTDAGLSNVEVRPFPPPMSYYASVLGSRA